ncbi:MAG: NYN domain-containing protein [Prochlorotrichaceae cyanobacterium]
MPSKERTLVRRFNTAIFYDLENLTQGSNFSKDFIQNFSLRPIYEKISELEIVEQVSLQRAYANWSDPRLSVLKNEINHLGIDPIQIFGFTRHPIKNAADIQLVVDAMDITLTRPHIDVYVVVSGDGGFAALAKKLHEYGRQVIGCAYETAANEIFKSVCDYFIELDPPSETIEPSKTIVYNDKGYGVGITHPLVVRLAQSIGILEEQNFAEILRYSEDLLNWFYHDTEARQQLETEGIHLSVIREAFKYGIPGFKPERIGFGKFAELLQFVCTDRPFCIALQPPSNLLLLSREHIPDTVEPLPDLAAADLHCLERYQNLLSSGKPRIVINAIFNDRLLFAQILHLFWSDRDQPKSLDVWIDRLAQQWSQFTIEEWHNFCLTLLNCEFLTGIPEEDPLNQQQLYWSADVPKLDQIFQQIQHLSHAKLHNILASSLSTEVFAQLFPW